MYFAWMESDHWKVWKWLTIITYCETRRYLRKAWRQFGLSYDGAVQM